LILDYGFRAQRMITFWRPLSAWRSGGQATSQDAYLLPKSGRARADSGRLWRRQVVMSDWHRSRSLISASRLLPTPPRRPPIGPRLAFPLDQLAGYGSAS
jgi:hypothetical protein